MKILFKYPTRNRPIIFKEMLNMYYNKLSGKHDYYFVITMDCDDVAMNNADIHNFLNSKKNIKYCYGNSKSKIEAINLNLEDEDFDMLILVSDDMLPLYHGYDDIIAQEMLKSFPNLDGTVHFNDGRVGRVLNTLCIMGKNLYKEWGYIYHPQYTSLWCDNEYTDVSYRDNKAVYIDKIIIKHGWHDITGDDKLAKRNQAFYEIDRAVYEKRKAAGFPKNFV